MAFIHEPNSDNWQKGNVPLTNIQQHRHRLHFDRFGLGDLFGELFVAEHSRHLFSGPFQLGVHGYLRCRCESLLPRYFHDHMLNLLPELRTW